jgi:hypothetical protein
VKNFCLDIPFDRRGHVAGIVARARARATREKNKKKRATKKAGLSTGQFCF